MRAIALVTILASAAFAGCTSSDDSIVAASCEAHPLSLDTPTPDATAGSLVLVVPVEGAADARVRVTAYNDAGEALALSTAYTTPEGQARVTILLPAGTTAVDLVGDYDDMRHCSSPVTYAWPADTTV